MHSTNQRITAVLLILATTSPALYARGLTEDTKQQLRENPQEARAVLTDDETIKENEERQQDFLSKYFGIGIYANVFLGKTAPIESARLVNGVVRVEETNRVALGLMLEAHKFINVNTTGTKGNGPYIGLVTGDNGLLTGASLGWMWAWRLPNDSSSMNLGLGAMVFPNTQVLGDGINENEPLPAGETDVRYKKVTGYGVAIAASFGF